MFFWKTLVLDWNRDQEHFYDIQSNKGFLEWRVKTVQRQSRTTSTSHNRVELKGGPTSSRTLGCIDDQQTRDECMEAMSLLHHTTDRDLVFQKMKETFQYRQQMLHDPQQSADILKTFPRFLDMKGLILQDFMLMFGEETASRFLGKWETAFKDKVIQEARTLRETPFLKTLLTSALNEKPDTTDEPVRDSDMASLLVLLHLLTPQPAGRKRSKKISVREATDHLVKFQKSCQSLEDHLMTTEGNPQPYLLLLCIRKIGPLIHIWTMSFEAKHKFFKRLCEELQEFDGITCKETPVCSSLSLGMLFFKSS